MEIIPQILDTGKFGVIEVVATWAKLGKSISKLANGAYVHTTGLPITDPREIKDVIPGGAQQDEALYWFEHRHDDPDGDPGRRIVMNPDGSFAFEDGDPITSITEITEALRPGPHQEVVIRWFIADQEKKARTQTKQPPEWQKPSQEEAAAAAAAAEGEPKATKKKVKKPTKKKTAPKKAAEPPATTSAPGPMTAPPEEGGEGATI